VKNTDETVVLPEDEQAMKDFISSDDCPLGMKMMFGGAPARALARAFARHRERNR
jgi:hypothetical protein